jgi:WD40 repeat protein
MKNKNVNQKPGLESSKVLPHKTPHSLLVYELIKMLREQNHALVRSRKNKPHQQTLHTTTVSVHSCPTQIAGPPLPSRASLERKGKSKNSKSKENEEEEEEEEAKTRIKKAIKFIAKNIIGVSDPTTHSEGCDDYDRHRLMTQFTWHKNKKDSFAISRFEGDGSTSVSVFDRATNGILSGDLGDDDAIKMKKMTKKKNMMNMMMMMNAAGCETPRIVNERVSAIAFRPNHASCLAIASKESSLVKVYSRTHVNDESATWKIESLQSDETRPLLDAALSDVKGVDGGVDILEFSPNGEFLATASSYGSTIRIWDVDAKMSMSMSSGNGYYSSAPIRRKKTFRIPKTKKELQNSFSSFRKFWETLVPIEFATKQNGIIALSFSRSGRHLAAVSKNGALTIWTKISGNWKEHDFTASSGKVTAFAWGPSPTDNVSRNNRNRGSGYVRGDETETGLCLIETHGGESKTQHRLITLSALEFTPVGTYAAALPIAIPMMGNDKFPSSEAAAVTSFVWDDTASRLVIAHADGNVRIYSTIINPAISLRAVGTFRREEEEDEDALADEEGDEEGLNKKVEPKNVAVSLQFSSGDSRGMHGNVDRTLSVTWGDGAISFVPCNFASSAVV